MMIKKRNYPAGIPRHSPAGALRRALRAKRWLCGTAFCMCLSVAVVPMQSMAALSDYDAETAARLQDDKLEYDELENLIREYNPSIKYAFDQLQFNEDETDANARRMRDANDEVKDQIKNLKEQRRKLDSIPGMESQKAAIDQAISGMNTLLDLPGTLIKSTDKQMEKAKKELETGIQQMVQPLQTVMITYDGLRHQQATLETVEELQTAALEAARLQRSIGTVTDVDVLSAQSALLSTETTLEGLVNAMGDIRSNLCIMTGWPADASPEIGSVPAPDLDAMASIDLQDDLVKAIGNNQTLIEMRHSSSEKSTSGVNNRLMNTEDAEERLKIEMQRLYQDMQAKKLSYDASLTAYESASLSWQGAQIKYQYGMISRIQLLGLQVQFVQAEGARASAESALYQAMNTYDWAVRGFVKIPD